jgi:hypothetical protein
MKKNSIVIGNLRHSFLMILTLLFFVGCGAGKTLVIKPPEAKIKVSSVNFSEGASTVNLPEKFKEIFKQKLTHLLFEESHFQKGSDINIEYRFLQYDPGNQFSRWFWGGIGNAGEGTLTVEAKFFNTDGKELSVIHSEGKISSGFFGGTFELALEKAAKEIVEHIEQNYQ